MNEIFANHGVGCFGICASEVWPVVSCQRLCFHWQCVQPMLSFLIPRIACWDLVRSVLAYAVQLTKLLARKFLNHWTRQWKGKWTCRVWVFKIAWEVKLLRVLDFRFSLPRKSLDILCYIKYQFRFLLEYISILVWSCRTASWKQTLVFFYFLFVLIKSSWTFRNEYYGS